MCSCDYPTMGKARGRDLGRETMRQIKFRAWENTRREMCDVLMIWPGQGATAYGLQFRGANGDLILSTTAAKEGVSLMQFTGLTDSNNVPIYEGDIVQRLGGKNTILTAVEWNDDACEMQYSDGTRLNADDNYGCWKSVRGNIYENAEILEQKQ